MSIANLMVYSPGPTFSFSHQNEHASLVWQMSQPTLFNIANYLLDPSPAHNLPAQNWAQAHQIAHDDAAQWYGVQPSLPLMDEKIGSPWWTFINYLEHSALNGAALVS